MSNNIFIEQLKRGEPMALETLVTEYKDSIFRTCIAYVQNKEDAEDLTQNVFIKAFEKLDQFKGDAKVSTWMVRIAINLSLNFLRDNKKRLLETHISDIDLPDINTKTLIDKEIKQAVRAAIFGLPKRQRKVFILYFYLELSYKNINEITGLSISSIESLLFRSRKNLKGSLIDFYKNSNS